MSIYHNTASFVKRGRRIKPTNLIFHKNNHTYGIFDKKIFTHFFQLIKLIFILRKFIAKGTSSQLITFTSAAQKPYLADWEAIVFQGDGSIIDNVIVEYTRNGLNPVGKQPNSVIQNSISRHSLWGAISAANSNIKIINNHLSDAGHEGIDLKYNGNQEVAGNSIDDCHTGIASIAGSQLIKNNTITNCGDGVYIDPKSSAMSIGNTFIPAPEESQRVWRYGNYVIPIFGWPEK